MGSNPTEGMDVSREDCVLSGRGLCNEPITHPDESYRLWCVILCDLETSGMRRPWSTGVCCAKKKDSTLSSNHVKLENYQERNLKFSRRNIPEDRYIESRH